MNRWLAFRSALDRAIAVALLVALSPVVAGLVLLVRRRDGSPAIIALPRVGQHARVFGMWKLRTMPADRPGGAAAGPAITLAADPRVTPLGQKLRAARLDELPQLLNVARGEMALIGPRPEAPLYSDPVDPRWQRILKARPGIAGVSQLLLNDWELEVLARFDGADPYGSCVLPLKLDIDQWYLQTASLGLDLRVGISLLERFVIGRSTTVVERELRRRRPDLVARREAALEAVLGSRPAQ